MMLRSRVTQATAASSRSGSSLNNPSPRLHLLHKTPRTHLIHARPYGQQEWSWSINHCLSWPGLSDLHIPHRKNGISASSLIKPYLKSFRSKLFRARSCLDVSVSYRSRRIRLRSSTASRFSWSNSGTHDEQIPWLYPRFGVYQYKLPQRRHIRSRGGLGFNAARTSRCFWLYATRPDSLHDEHIGGRPISVLASTSFGHHVLKQVRITTRAIYQGFQ